MSHRKDIWHTLSWNCDLCQVVYGVNLLCSCSCSAWLYPLIRLMKLGRDRPTHRTHFRAFNLSQFGCCHFNLNTRLTSHILTRARGDSKYRAARSENNPHLEAMTNYEDPIHMSDECWGRGSSKIHRGIHQHHLQELGGHRRHGTTAD